jgi:hypothetical protein
VRSASYNAWPIIACHCTYGDGEGDVRREWYYGKAVGSVVDRDIEHEANGHAHHQEWPHEIRILDPVTGGPANLLYSASDAPKLPPSAATRSYQPGWTSKNLMIRKPKSSIFVALA